LNVALISTRTKCSPTVLGSRVLLPARSLGSLLALSLESSCSFCRALQMETLTQRPVAVPALNRSRHRQSAAFACLPACQPPLKTGACSSGRVTPPFLAVLRASRSTSVAASSGLSLDEPAQALTGAARSRVLLVAYLAFGDLLCYSLVFPLLPFFAAQFAASPVTTGALIGCFALAQMVSSPLLGRVSDRLGRKPVLVLTTLGTVVGFLIVGFTHSLALLFVARLVDGLSGGNTTPSQAYIADTVGAGPARAQGFAWLACAGALGFVCGPLIGGTLAASHLGLRSSALCAAALAAVNLLLMAVFLPESTTPEERNARWEFTQASAAASRAAQLAVPRTGLGRFIPSGLVQSPRVSLLLFLRVAWSLPFNALFTTFSLFLSLRGLSINFETTGRVLAFAGLLQIAVQAFAVAPLTRMVDEDTLLCAALAVGGVSLVYLGLAPTLPLLMAGLVPTALASAVFGTVAATALSKAASPGSTGALLGLSFSFEAATRVVAPVVAGAISSWAGAAAIGLSGGAFIFSALPIALFTLRSQQKESALQGGGAPVL